MTLPRSSGWTRTSRTLPRRIARVETWTSSGFSTMPLTRCSSASSSTSGLAARLTARGRVRRGRLRLGGSGVVSGTGGRLLGAGLGLGPARLGLGVLGLRLGVGLGLLGLVLGASVLGVSVGLGLAVSGLPAPAAALGRGRTGVTGVLGRRLQGFGEHFRLGRRDLAGAQGALGPRLALELLPVARDLEDGEHRLRGAGGPGEAGLGPRPGHPAVREALSFGG